MNNLLRTLTESQVTPAADLRLLLSTVKEGRRQSYDSKLTDPFYDSLEGLLLDLRTITIDNHDAEAFLKPVSRSEVPDYYEVIQHPMDFQTMLKKVKQKQYKSKREFKDDLDLIWSNCLTYNATEGHPLRVCVKRLKVKAEKLLKHITDRKERADPAIPSDLPSSSKLNGIKSHTRSPSVNLPTLVIPARPRRDVEFGDFPAIIRTPEGMAMFYELNSQVDLPRPKSTVVHTLRSLAPIVEYESDTEPAADTATGEKRKMNGTSQRRPRKKARFTTQYPTPLVEEKDDISQLWWGAVQSDQLLGNGLPPIPFGPSSSKRPKKAPSSISSSKKKKSTQRIHPAAPNPKSLLTMMNNNIKTMRRLRHTHAKFAAIAATTAPQEDEEQQMGGGEAGLFGGAGTAASSSKGPGVAAVSWDDDPTDDKIDESPWVLGRGRVKNPSKLSGVEMGEANAADCLHWATDKILEHSGFQGTSSVARNVLADVFSEYLQNVGRTIRFLSDKFGKTMTSEEIILHTLFESGTSRVQDLERYISDDIERYGSRLGELEKKIVGAYRETAAGEILEDEGLFEEEDEEETGALAMGDFADLLGEDYLGFRELGIAAELGLSNLTIPKKLLKKKGQNKPTAAKPSEPPPPYPPPPPFIPFTAGKVEDQIGLLKPYYQSRFTQLSATVAPPQAASSGLPLPSLPGPSIPPPPPPPHTLPPNTLPSTSTPTPTNPPLSSVPPPPSVPIINPDLVLTDELPNSTQMKIGPLGQILTGKAGGAATTTKSKKAKADTAAHAAGPVAPPPPAPVHPPLPHMPHMPLPHLPHMPHMAPPLLPGGGLGAPGTLLPGLDSIPNGAHAPPVLVLPGNGHANVNGRGSSSPKKKKNLGVGTGNGRKKKGDGNGEGGAGGQGQGQKGSNFPPVVFASA